MLSMTFVRIGNRETFAFLSLDSLQLWIFKIDLSGNVGCILQTSKLPALAASYTVTQPEDLNENAYGHVIIILFIRSKELLKVRDLNN